MNSNPEGALRVMAAAGISAPADSVRTGPVRVVAVFEPGTVFAVSAEMPAPPVAAVTPTAAIAPCTHTSPNAAAVTATNSFALFKPLVPPFRRSGDSERDPTYGTKLVRGRVAY